MKKYFKKTKKKKEISKKKSNTKSNDTTTISYEIMDDKKENINDFSQEEYTILENELVNIKKDLNEGLCVNEVEENETVELNIDNTNNKEEENIEEIKEDFLDESDYFSSKDNYSENGKIIYNNNLNNVKVNLNNSSNPFIKAAIKTKKEINKQNKNNENYNLNSENKYNSKPPYNFNKVEGKILEKKIINFAKEDLLDFRNEKNPFNFWYKKFNYLGKSYIQMTKTKQGKNKDYIIYYCNKHFTTIDSNKYSNDGKKLKVSKCYSRIFYFKEREEYIIDWLHSDFCNKIVKEEYENKADIEAEVNNYKEFRKQVKEWLDKNPVIKYRDFKKKAISFYFKCQCNFEIKENTFKNIYYSWRKETPLYKKQSIFKFNKTIDNFQYLRDYNYTFIYNESGKKLFLHEHIIYCSDYFIKKLRNSNHWYIDATFVAPPSFTQMFVILYRDDNTGKRYPGLYALINNKTKEGYLYMFKKIISIITIENSKKLNLITYSIDFEKSLIDSLKIVLPEIRSVGCFYHYCKNIYNNAKKVGLLKETLYENTDILLKSIYQLPYKFNSMKESEIEILFTKLYKTNKLYEDFYNYFKKTWIPFYQTGMLNYVYLSKEQRCNSYIENYNRIIKEKLSNFLYGKNKCRISWPLLLYFIINEENEYKNNIIKNENEV